MVWKEILTAVIRNSFEKLNLSFRTWQLNFSSDSLGTVVKEYFSNNALCLLNETTVTQYIFSEFIGSPLTNGLFLNGENRHYQIFREQEFKWTSIGRKALDESSITKKTKKKKVVDLISNRLKWEEGDGKLEASKIPSIIEAKRVKGYHVKNGEFMPNTYDNIIGIKNDIGYLKLLHNPENFKKKLYDNHEIKKYRTYVLIWDYAVGNKEQVLDVTKSNIRQILDIDGNALNEVAAKIVYIPSKINSTLTIESCIWFLLHEIDNPNIVAADEGFFEVK